jgi:polyhydroxyalkanoate synthase
VWNYVVGNYLKGETPPPFDLLYWNSDSTNLPGRCTAWYLRNTYLKTSWSSPGKATVCGEKVDLRKVDMPVYIYGSREDHIVPWRRLRQSPHLPGKKRFVMGASGHIAGVINPPAKGKRSHWVRRQVPGHGVDAWLDGATEHPAAGGPTGPTGSSHGGKQVPRPRPMATASTRPSSRRRAATSRPRPDPGSHFVSLLSFEVRILFQVTLCN